MKPSHILRARRLLYQRIALLLLFFELCICGYWMYVTPFPTKLIDLFHGNNTVALMILNMIFVYIVSLIAWCRIVYEKDSPDESFETGQESIFYTQKVYIIGSYCAACIVGLFHYMHEYHPCVLPLIAMSAFLLAALVWRPALVGDDLYCARWGWIGVCLGILYIVICGICVRWLVYLQPCYYSPV